MSGHVYRLGHADAGELEAELAEHLRYALHHWGFEAVRNLGLPSVVSGRSQERASNVSD